MAIYKMDRSGQPVASVMLKSRGKKPTQKYEYFKGYLEIGGSLYQIVTTGSVKNSAKNPGTRVMICDVKRVPDRSEMRGL